MITLVRLRTIDSLHGVYDYFLTIYMYLFIFNNNWISNIYIYIFTRSTHIALTFDMFHFFTSA